MKYIYIDSLFFLSLFTDYLLCLITARICRLCLRRRRYLAAALLGAAALGDIGRHFPDSDNAYKNINSRILLKKTASLIKEKGFKAVNIDATVIAQRPKLAPFIPDMAKNIAEDCCLPLSAVNVKATTEEGLGFTGALEGISAHAMCLIE